MKVTIDLDHLKEYLSSQSDDKDEWYGAESYMIADCFREYFKTINMSGLEEFSSFVNTLGND